MQAQNINELKKVATIGYLISGLSMGLWSSHLLARVNLAVVGAVASSAGLAPIRKRQTQRAIEEAKKQLDTDYADRREQLKDWERDLQGRSVDLDSRQMDLDRESQQLRLELDREREQWERERDLTSQATEMEIRDRQQALEAEYQQRFAMRQKEIEQEYATLDVERKSLDADLTQFEVHRDRQLAAIEQERELIEKQPRKRCIPDSQTLKPSSKFSRYRRVNGWLMPSNPCTRKSPLYRLKMRG